MYAICGTFVHDMNTGDMTFELKSSSPIALTFKDTTLIQQVSETAKMHFSDHYPNGYTD